MKWQAAASILLAIAAAAPADEPAAAPSPGEERRERLRDQLDWERSAEELPPLRRSPTLDAAAQARADRLASLAPAPSLLEELAAAGYRAEAAEMVKLLGGGSPERKVSTVLERNPEVRDLVLGDELPEVGVGTALEAGRPLDVIIFAKSRAEAFGERTAGLADAEAVRAELVKWSNWAREEYGDAVRPLAPDACLDGVAQTYADQMLAGGFFGHISPAGRNVTQRVRAAACPALAVGENLASGPTDAVDVVASWLESPSHRRQLLSRDYDRVGFGVAFGEGPAGRQVLWVQVLSGG